MYGTNDFQLLEARASDAQPSLKLERNTLHVHPHAVFGNGASDTEDREHITAIIGKNGTGKSLLLSSIVRSFLALEQYAEGRRTARHLPLDYLSYRIDGKICRVEQHRNQPPYLSVDGELVPPQLLPLPRRVVALTISPFDKFPVPDSLPFSVARTENSIYHYLGLRDRFGKSAIETLLFRSLTNLFETTENEALRRTNIGAVFDFLHLRPTVTVIYRMKISTSVRDAIEHGRHLLEPGVIEDQFLLRRVEEVVKSGIDEGDLRQLLLLALKHLENRSIRMTANFEAGGVLDPLFRIFQPLRRAGFLRLSEVEVTQKDGRVSDLRRGSSGQISMVSALVALASAITNGSLVLIDEPELSLHPEWQVKYIDLLIRTFGRYRGCHFVVATHSPLVISELPKHANVVSLDREELPPVEQLTGQSADYLLAEAFGLPTNGNLHVRDRIASALRLVADGKANSDEFAQRLKVLERFSDELEPTDPAKTIIQNLQDIADHAGKAAK